MSADNQLTCHCLIAAGCAVTTWEVHRYWDRAVDIYFIIQGLELCIRWCSVHPTSWNFFVWIVIHTCYNHKIWKHTEGRIILKGRAKYTLVEKLWSIWGQYKPGLWTGPLDSIMDSIFGLEFRSPGVKDYVQITQGQSSDVPWCHQCMLIICMLSYRGYCYKSTYTMYYYFLEAISSEFHAVLFSEPGEYPWIDKHEP